MNDTINILGIAGSLRRESYNRSALRAAIDLVPDGARLETFELNDIPVFNQDKEQDPPASVVELKRRIRAADAILFVTPEHNYSIPAVLKNAIDWASRPYGDNAWDGKVAAVMGASIAVIGTARAQYHLRQTLVFLNMLAVTQPEVMIGTAHERFDKNGNLIDDSTKEHISGLLQSLVDLSRTFNRGRNSRVEDVILPNADSASVIATAQ
jgi:chromate reductase